MSRSVGHRTGVGSRSPLIKAVSLVLFLAALYYMAAICFPGRVFQLGLTHFRFYPTKYTVVVIFACLVFLYFRADYTAEVTERETVIIPRKWIFIFFMALALFIFLFDWKILSQGHFSVYNWRYLCKMRWGEYTLWNVLFNHSGASGLEGRYRPFELLPWWAAVRLWDLCLPCYLIWRPLYKWIGALLVFLCGRRLFKNDYAALAGSLFFAVHPMIDYSTVHLIHPEFLCALFILGSWLFFMKYLEERRTGHLALSLILYACASLTKELAFILPAFLLLYAFLHREERMDWTIFKRNVLLPCIPFLLLTIVLLILHFLLGGLQSLPITGSFKSVNQIAQLVLYTYSAYNIDVAGFGPLANQWRFLKPLWFFILSLILLLNYRSHFSRFNRQAVISLCFSLLFFIPLGTILLWPWAMNRTYMVSLGFCFFLASLFYPLGSTLKWKRLIFLTLLFLLCLEFSITSARWRESDYLVSSRGWRTICPAIASYVSKRYPAEEPIAFFILGPGETLQYCHDSLIKVLGGRSLINKVIIPIHQPPGEWGDSHMLVPEELARHIWVDPGVSDPRDLNAFITWNRENERCITLAQTTELPPPNLWKYVRLRGPAFYSMELGKPPSVEKALQMDWSARFLKVDGRGELTDVTRELRESSASLDYPSPD